MNPEVGATSVILAILSPLLVALIAKRQWDVTIKELVAVGVVSGLYVLGQLIDGILIVGQTIPPSFWLGLSAVFGLQQAVYKFIFRGSTAIKELENVGSAPPRP